MFWWPWARTAPSGKYPKALFHHGLAFTFGGLVHRLGVVQLAFTVQPLIASFEGIDRRLAGCFRRPGRQPLRTFLKIIVPLSWPGIVTAVVLSFAHTLGEFGVVLMVGGNLPGITRTVSIDIYDHVQSLEYAEANHMALLLLLISFTVLAVVYGVNRKVGRNLWAPWAK